MAPDLLGLLFVVLLLALLVSKLS